MTRLCVVGAGVAAARATDALADEAPGVDVTVLEKARGVGGRTATRRRRGCRYDHGANYVKGADAATTDLLRGLGEDGLVDVAGPVWTFDADGTISPGRNSDAHKWTWASGITQLAKRLFARTDAEVRTETRAETVRRGDHATGDQDDGGGEDASRDQTTGEDAGTDDDDSAGGEPTWSVVDAEGRAHGPFDAVLLTPPAPQTARLLADAEWDAPVCERLRSAAAAVDYRTVRTVVLHYEFSLDVPWYALVDTSKDHDVGWLAREECKPGHVPDGEGLLVAQMSPGWSTANDDRPLDAVADEVAEALAALVGDDRLTEFDWCDDQGWRYALPEAGLDPAATRAGEAAGLFLAGDWVAGEGRVHAALQSGEAAATRIRERL